MPNIWVGGDWHLWNVNLRDERHPFRSKQNIEEFKQYLASKPIQPDDVFLVLGDLCDPEITDAQNLRDVIAAIPPCMKVLVKGNHDTAEDSLYLNAGFDLVTDIVLIHHMVFSHIPVYVSHEQLNIHAHLHSVKISVFDERYVNVKNVDPCILLDDLLDRAMRQNKSEYEGVDNDRYIQNFFRNIEEKSHMDQPEERRIMDLSHLVPEYPMDESVLNEYIFNNPDEARMWLADDDTPPKPDNAPEGEEKDNRKYVQTNLNTFQEAAVVGPAVNTPEDLSKWMKRNIRYGNYRKLMTPAEVMDTGSGSCHDQVTFAYPILRAMENVNPRILFFIATNPNKGTSGQTHSLIWWSDPADKKVYWFENSWGGNQGIHKFDSEEDMKASIEKRYKEGPEAKNYPELVFKSTSIKKFKEGITLGDLVNDVYHGTDANEAAVPSVTGDAIDEILFPDDVSRNISESASTPATLYHGSPKTFKVARVHDSGTSGAHLFATSMRSFALAYAGAEWSDFEINQSWVNGDMYLTEILPGKFREVFSRPGYLHILPADTFKSFHGVEFISDEDVRVQKTYKISNVLKELQKAPDVKLYYYPDLPPFIQDRERYLRDMAIKYNHNIDKILAMTKELRVEVKESTNPNDGQSSKAVELTFYLGNDKVGEAGVSGYDTGAGFLYDLEVVERFRGKGYSKQILDYVMKNYSVTDLSVAVDNKVAINLYEKFGFKLKKTFNSNGENGYEKGRFRWYQLDESVDDSETEYLEHPEVKDDIINGEQIKFFQDQQTYKESLPDESVEVGQVDGYQFSLEEEIVFNDDDLLDEAVSENSKLYPVYVLLVHTGTKLSSAILKVTNAEFGHACISFDSSLKKMYSFGRKDPKNPFAGGFVMESLGEGFYNQEVMDKTHYAIYVVPCTKYQIEKMKKRLQYFIKNKSKFIFDFFGLITNYFGIVANPKLRYFCSRFVADILNAGANNKKKYIKEPSLMDPEDFKHTDFAHFVAGGMLCNYNPDEVNIITRGILKSQELIRKQTGKLQYHTFGEAATYSDKIQWYKNAIRNETVEEYERSTKELRICFTPDMRMKLDKENYEVFYAVYRHLLTSFIDCREYDTETRMELYGKLQSLVKFFQQYFFPSVTDPATNEFTSVYTRLHAEILRGLSVCQKKLDTTVIPESVTYFQSGRTIPYLTETVYVVPY